LAGEVGHTDAVSTLALRPLAEQIGIGVAVGVVLTGVGSRLLRTFADRGWVTETWRQLPVVALTVACFAVAQALGGRRARWTQSAVASVSTMPSVP